MKIKHTVLILLNLTFATSSALALEPLTREQKMAEIESLKAYEEKVKRIKSQGNQSAIKVYESSGELYLLPNSQLLHPDFYRTTPTRPQKPNAEFVCDQSLTADCDTQKTQHYYGVWDEKPKFYVDGKYIVGVSFINDKSFPEKPLDNALFPQASVADAPEFKEKLYAYYLGDNYKDYSPSLATIYNSVSLDILIKNSEELTVFLDNPKVVGIYHVGNSADLPEQQPATRIYHQ